MPHNSSGSPSATPAPPPSASPIASFLPPPTRCAPTLPASLLVGIWMGDEPLEVEGFPIQLLDTIDQGIVDRERKSLCRLEEGPPLEESMEDPSLLTRVERR